MCRYVRVVDVYYLDTLYTVTVTVTMVSRSSMLGSRYCFRVCLTSIFATYLSKLVIQKTLKQFFTGQLQLVLGNK